MKARVFVTLKTGVLDPQGAAIRHALGTLGFDGVEEVRQGKVIDLELAETEPAKAEAARSSTSPTRWKRSICSLIESPCCATAGA